MTGLATKQRTAKKGETDTFEEKRARILKWKVEYRKDSRKRFVPATNYRNAPRQVNPPAPELVNPD